MSGGVREMGPAYASRPATVRRHHLAAEETPGRATQIDRGAPRRDQIVCRLRRAIRQQQALSSVGSARRAAAPVPGGNARERSKRGARCTGELV